MEQQDTGKFPTPIFFRVFTHMIQEFLSEFDTLFHVVRFFL